MTNESVTPDVDNSAVIIEPRDHLSDASGRSESGVLESEWSNRRIVVWFTCAFLLLFLITLLLIAPLVQQRLERQTMDRLAQAGIDGATLSFDWDYRNLTVNGYLPENVSPGELALALRGTPDQPSAFFAKGIRHLRLNIDEGVPVAGAFSEESLLVQVSGSGNAVTLSGVVQNEAQRKTLSDALLASGIHNLSDNLDVQSIADTEPVNLRVTVLAELLQELGPEQSKRAEVKLTEDELYYRVTARDKDSAFAIERSVAADIDGFNITGGVDLLSQSRLDLLAESNGEEITLTGEVFSAAQKKQLVFAASEAVGGRNVIDNLTVASVQSDSSALMERVESMSAVISRFAPGITGDVALKNDELVVNAEAGSEAVRDYLVLSTADAGSAGLNVVDNIQVFMPQDDSRSLQLALDELIDEVRRTVVFPSGASVLSPVARQTLDKVAQKINDYSGLVVEIEGHTDNVGRAGTNEQLSQTRANSVRSYLASRLNGRSSDQTGGSSRLIAVGYGHRRPIETNDTAEGRQANRRVHFTVLKQPQGLNG